MAELVVVEAIILSGWGLVALVTGVVLLMEWRRERDR